MSYLGTALTRIAERRHLSQADIARQSGVSRSYLSRLCSGEARDLSDSNFISILNVFAADPTAQAELTAARCMDVRVGPATHLVEIAVAGKQSQSIKRTGAGDLVELSAETERAFAWLRRQCPLNPDLEQHIVGYAKLTGMK